eukprot:1903207-Ditylum_brightwellii.AAC.2
MECFKEVRLHSCEGKGQNGLRAIMLTLKKILPCFISSMTNWTASNHIFINFCFCWPFLLLQSSAQIIPIDKFHVRNRQSCLCSDAFCYV